MAEFVLQLQAVILLAAGSVEVWSGPAAAAIAGGMVLILVLVHGGRDG